MRDPWMKTSTLWAWGAAMALATLMVTPASAQERAAAESKSQPFVRFDQEPPAASRMRLALGGAFGFGGSGDGEISANGQTEDLGSVDADTTLGVFARFEGPLHCYFSLGGQLSALFLSSEDSEGSRDRFINLSALPKLRLPYTLDSLYSGEVYAMMPVGFTASLLTDIEAEDGIDTFGPGWHIGLMLGVQQLFHERVGALLEMGWMRHAVSHGGEFDGESFDIKLSLNQFALNVGVFVLL